MDHGLLEEEFTVSASLRRQCFNITIINDDVAEEDEFFQVSLTSIRRIAGNNIYEVLIRRATVTIIDDDCKSIKFQIRSPNGWCLISVTCNPECVNGFCRFPGACQCHEGWTDEDCSRGFHIM